MNKLLMSLFGALLMLMIFQSCGRDEFITPEEFPKLINLEVGNYWIYEIGTVLEDGTFKKTKNDTIEILNEVFEVGVKLYEISGSFNIDNLEKSYLYDSLNYLIEYPSRNVLFTTDTSYVAEFDAFLFNASQRLEKETELISVGAGEFESYNYKTTFNLKDPSLSQTTLESNTHFANDVGMVKINGQFASSGIVFEKRLLSFGKK